MPPTIWHGNGWHVQVQAKKTNEVDHWLNLYLHLAIVNRIAVLTEAFELNHSNLPHQNHKQIY
jgi:hypothetical protein